MEGENAGSWGGEGREERAGTGGRRVLRGEEVTAIKRLAVAGKTNQQFTELRSPSEVHRKLHLFSLPLLDILGV